jgi:hypothetical protein
MMRIIILSGACCTFSLSFLNEDIERGSMRGREKGETFFLSLFVNNCPNQTFTLEGKVQGIKKSVSPPLMGRI